MYDFNETVQLSIRNP